MWVHSPTCFIFLAYRSHLGAHSDALSRIGPDAIVVGLSLGAKRVFMVQEKLPWGVKPPTGSGSEGTKKVILISRKHQLLLRCLFVCLFARHPTDSMASSQLCSALHVPSSLAICAPFTIARCGRWCLRRHDACFNKFYEIDEVSSTSPPTLQTVLVRGASSHTHVSETHACRSFF